MRHSAIDLAAYAPPSAVEELDAEAALSARKEAFMASFAKTGASAAELAEMRRMLDYEYEPLVGLLEQDAYCDTIFTARLNDKARAVLLATAYDTTLDHIGATYYRTERRVVTPADPETGATAVLEDDETYRQRLALAPESWSSAGPEGAYLFFGLIDGVLDIAAYSEDEGCALAPTVRVPILSSIDNGSAPTPALIAAVAATLNAREIRPLGDRVVVEAAQPVAYDVAVTLLCKPGASVEIVRAAAQARIAAYCSGRIRWTGDAATGPVWLIGRRIRIGTLAAAARVDGVEEVVVTSPAADVNAPAAGYAAALPLPINAAAALDDALTAHLFRAPLCASIAITIQTVAEGWSS